MSIQFFALDKIGKAYGTKAGKMKLSVPGDAAGVRMAAPEKTDTITISTQGSLQRDAARIAKNVLGEVMERDSAYASRVETLRAQVEGGTYGVPSGAVADAIMGRAYGMSE